MYKNGRKGTSSICGHSLYGLVNFMIEKYKLSEAIKRLDSEYAIELRGNVFYNNNIESQSFKEEINCKITLN